MKKTYRKPNMCMMEEVQGIVPLAAVAAGAAAVATELAPAAALVGGYAVGRGVKQMMEARPTSFNNRIIEVME